MKLPDLLKKLISLFGHPDFSERKNDKYSLRNQRVRFFDIPKSVYLVIKKYGLNGFYHKTILYLVFFVHNIKLVFTSFVFSCKEEGLKIALVRSVNYVFFGKGKRTFGTLKNPEGLGWRFSGRRNDLSKVSIFEGQPGKIVVVAHVFYVDLLDEMVGYLSNIPYRYDLFITVVRKSDAERVRNLIDGRLPNCGIVRVEVIPNRGRDISSLVVTFAGNVLKYDYICHIHTKKSLYTKSEQASWRRYLLEGLLGNEWTIKKIFGLFDSEKIGLIYPQSFESLPYWAHTWLSNRNIGGRLFMLLNLEPKLDGYIDYPMGSMFWAKVDALRPLFTLGLRYEDFPKEEGEIRDGTLAHAIERIFCILCRASGYDYSEVNFIENNYTLSCGDRNFRQYLNKTTDDLKNIIRNYDVISFDIFDTLLIRPLLNPDLVFDILGKNAESRYKISDFKRIRKEAELGVRKYKNFSGDVTIDETYERIKTVLSLQDKIVRNILEMEVELESRLLSEREDILEVLKYAKSIGKRVIFVSDTYFNKEHIDSFLNKNGLLLYDEIYLSSQIGKRKDDGTLWDYVLEREGRDLLHIGDNEHSDVQIPLDKGGHVYHILSLRNSFENFLNLGFYSQKPSEKVFDNLILGLVGRRMFRNAFPVSARNGEYLRSLRDFGYVVYGPILLTFFLWLLHEVCDKKIEKVFFLSRDGYFLKKIYDSLLDNDYFKGLDLPRSEYLLVSRRAVTVPSIEKKEDIDKLLIYHYKGSLHNLLEKRFGVLPFAGEKDIRLALPADFKNVRRIIERYSNKIIESAKKEKGAVKKYAKAIGLERGSVLVDLGYSGTIQKSLNKILSINTKGLYFATKNDISEVDYKACFRFDGENAIHKYSLLLEAFLTSPDGQLISYGNGNGRFVFGEPEESQQNMSKLEKIADGTTDFINDFFSCFGSDFNREFENSVVPGLIYGYFAENPEIVAKDIREILSVEDHYCGFGEISVFDFYQKMRKSQ